MKKILILGGAGFIGNNLSKKLINDKRTEVHIIDNFSRKDIKNTFHINKKIKLFNYDLNNNLLFKKIRKDYSYIINLAAILGVEKVISNSYQTLLQNIMMQSNAIQIAKMQKKLKKFIFFSTSEVYRYSIEKKIESIPTKTNINLLLSKKRNKRDSYMLSKICGEYLCEFSGLPFIIIRPHNIFGPNMGTRHVIPELILKIKEKNVIDLVNSNHIRSFCYIDDAIQMIVKIIKKNALKNRIINIGSDKNIFTIKSLAKRLAVHLNKNVTFKMTYKKITFDSPKKRIPNVKYTKKISKFKKETNFDVALIETIKSYS